MDRFEGIYRAIKSGCISNIAAKSAAIEVIKFLDSKCDCKPGDTTGSMKIEVCNICGRSIVECKSDGHYSKID